MKKKLSILLFCVLGALIVLLGVITYINFQSGDKYKKQVLSQAQQKYQNRTMPAKRGTIYDRNGNILATSNKVYNVVLDCKAVNSDEDYLDPTVNALVTIFGLDEGELRTRLSPEFLPWSFPYHLVCCSNPRMLSYHPWRPAFSRSDTDSPWSYQK